jgi:cytochrome c peroxidase
MHNGMLPTLADVLRFYNEGRSRNPNVVDRGDDGDRGGRRGVAGGLASLSGGFRRVGTMTEGEMRDIIAFLESLTDTDFDRTIPVRVPSGLPPGGAIRSSGARVTTNAAIIRKP